MFEIQNSGRGGGAMQRRRWFGLWGLLAVAACSAACGADSLPGEVSARPGSGTEAAVERGTPAGLRAAYIAAVQAGAPAEYRVDRSGSGLRAVSPAQALVSEFTADGVRISPEDGRAGFRYSMRTVRYGCEGDLRPLPGGPPEESGNRVTYRHEGTEASTWYVNGPLGLEQGFTLASAPPCGGPDAGALVIEIETGGDLTAAAVDGGEALSLRDSGGREVLRYADLHVADATGRALPARMMATEVGVEIRVEAQGAVYPVAVDPLVGKQQMRQVAPDGVAGDHFGYSVSISGDTAVVGSIHHYHSGSGAKYGAAYVFVRTAGSWDLETELHGDDGNTGDIFGSSVAISGETIVVGAENEDIAAQNSGSAYVFVRSGTIWTQQKKLLPPNGTAGDNFGHSVAVYGDTAVVGRPYNDGNGADSGDAYVFMRSGVLWSQGYELVPDDPATDQFFGYSVGISGDTIIVGAQGDSGAAPAAGATYIFVRSGAVWQQQAKIVASDGVEGDFFGGGVVIDGDTAVIGALGKDEGGKANAGAAYVFVRSAGVWSQEKLLVPDDSAAGDTFGFSVALEGDLAVVGADTDFNKAGSTYLFARTGGDWVQQDKILADGGSSAAAFGRAVSISGDTVMVGAPFDDSGAVQDLGSVYAFLLRLGDGELCATNTQCASGYCVDSVCCASACDDTCTACTAALKGSGEDGECGAIAGGTDPDEECAAEDEATCGNTGVCSGVGACQKYPNGMVCGEDHVCSAGKCMALPPGGEPDAGATPPSPAGKTPDSTNYYACSAAGPAQAPPSVGLAALGALLALGLRRRRSLERMNDYGSAQT
jgi:MYXO-CTERM domain-containing protein